MMLQGVVFVGQISAAMAALAAIVRLTRELRQPKRRPSCNAGWIRMAIPICTMLPIACSAADQSPQPTEFEKFQLIVLRRPEMPREYPKEELEKIQAAHLAHLRSLAVAGKLVVAGPLGDQPDASWRGICIFRTSGIEEARQLEEDDPAVKAGRLEVVAMSWYTEKGAMTFPIAERMVREGH